MGRWLAWLANFSNKVDCADPIAEAVTHEKLSIYKIPSYIESLSPDSFKPRVFTFGPVHRLSYDQSYKYRALKIYLINRRNLDICDFYEAVKDVIQQVKDAYEQPNHYESFEESVLLDGCFMLEFMRAAVEGIPEGYHDYDPIFSSHGVSLVQSTVQRDMLVLNNQLPLVVLERIVAFETRDPNNADYVHNLILKFFDLRTCCTPNTLALHVLDLMRKSILCGDRRLSRQCPEDLLIPASKCRQGITEVKCLKEVLRRDCLSEIYYTIPSIAVTSWTETMFFNLMAFERLHLGAGTDIRDYVAIVANMASSAKDADRLRSCGIISYCLGMSNSSVALLFARLLRGVEY